MARFSDQILSLSFSSKCPALVRVFVDLNHDLGGKSKSGSNVELICSVPNHCALSLHFPFPFPPLCAHVVHFYYES